MKAKELMIGDWVRFPIGNDKIVDLHYVEGKGICASFSASATLFPVPVSEIEPIPLTPEILERNGFTYSQRESNSLCRAFVFGEGKSHTWAMVVLYELPIAGCEGVVQIETDSQTCNGINKVHNCDIHYVHELQHALKLCGIEKEITL